MYCNDLVFLAKVRFWMSFFLSELLRINYYWSGKLSLNNKRLSGSIELTLIPYYYYTPLKYLHFIWQLSLASHLLKLYILLIELF
jgi:hypothetical protein